MRRLLSSVSVLAITAGGLAPAVAADVYNGIIIQNESLPAVSQVNGKISKGFGVNNDEAIGLITGSLSVPLSHSYGMQLDGILGTRDGDFIGHGAVHLFWRDPGKGLVGVYGSITPREDLDLTIGRLGIELEKYWDRVTVRTLFGAEMHDLDNSSLVDPDDGFFAFTDLSYYVTDNLELSIGHRYFAERHAAALGLEYQLDQTIFDQHVALFAEGRLGEDDYEAAWGGIKVYFGEDKSLIRRHREDDPDVWGEEDFYNLLDDDSVDEDPPTTTIPDSGGET